MEADGTTFGGTNYMAQVVSVFGRPMARRKVGFSVGTRCIKPHGGRAAEGARYGVAQRQTVW